MEIELPHPAVARKEHRMATKKVQPANPDSKSQASAKKTEAVKAGRKSARKTSGFNSVSDRNVKRDIVAVTW